MFPGCSAMVCTSRDLSQLPICEASVQLLLVHELGTISVQMHSPRTFQTAGSYNVFRKNSQEELLIVAPAGIK